MAIAINSYFVMIHFNKMCFTWLAQIAFQKIHIRHSRHNVLCSSSWLVSANQIDKWLSKCLTIHCTKNKNKFSIGPPFTSIVFSSLFFSFNEIRFSLYFCMYWSFIYFANTWNIINCTWKKTALGSFYFIRIKSIGKQTQFVLFFFYLKN